MKDCEVCICPDCRKQEKCAICKDCYNSPKDNAKCECPYGGFEED